MVLGHIPWRHVLVENPKGKPEDVGGLQFGTEISIFDKFRGKEGIESTLGEN